MLSWNRCLMAGKESGPSVCSVAILVGLVVLSWSDKSTAGPEVAYRKVLTTGEVASSTTTIDLPLMRRLAKRLEAVCAATTEGDYALASRAWSYDARAKRGPQELAWHLDLNTEPASCSKFRMFWDERATVEDLPPISANACTGVVGVSVAGKVEFVIEQGHWKLDRVDDLFLTKDPQARARGILNQKAKDRIRAFGKRPRPTNLPDPSDLEIKLGFHPPKELLREFADFTLEFRCFRLIQATSAIGLAQMAEEAKAYCANLKIGDVTDFTVGYLEPSKDWASWTIDPETGEGRLRYLRYYEEGYPSARVWTGYGRAPRTDGRRSVESKPEESNVPRQKRQVLCVRPFPYAADVQQFIRAKVVAAVEERDRIIMREWSK